MPPRFPSLKPAPSRFNKGRALPSSSSQPSASRTTSRSIHIEADVAEKSVNGPRQKERQKTTFISVQETTPAPLQHTGDASTDPGHADDLEPQHTSYYIQDEDTQHAQKRRKTKIRIRRVRLSLPPFFPAHVSVCSGGVDFFKYR